MKTNRLLITLVLCGWLFTACGVKQTPVLAVPEGAKGGDTVGYHAFFVGMLDSKLVLTAMANTNEGDVISPSMAALQQYLSLQTENK